MTPTPDGGVDADLDGLSLAEAVDEIAGDDGPLDPAQAMVGDPTARNRDDVRVVLEHVTDEDGVVTWDAVDDAVAHAAQVVSTPETRVELASVALDDARETAEPVADVDLVEERLATFEERLASLEDRVSELTDQLGTVRDVADGSGSLYFVASGVHSLVTQANEVQAAADRLQEELASFEEWVEDPEARADRLAVDVDAVAATLDDAAGVADAIEAAADGRDELDLAERPGTVDAGVAWFDATVRQRMGELLLDDLYAETETLYEWADREGADAGGLDEVADRLDRLDERAAILRDRLDDLARQEWRDRFGEEVAEVESTFDDLEPPVDWGEVQSTLERFRTIG